MTEKTENKKKANAKLRHLRTSPRKVRLLADIIRGLPVQEAEAQLMLSPKRSSKDLLKLLRSAVANAENNHEMNSHNLYIKEIRVDEGPTLKRWNPRAFGAVNEIHKRTSHISIILEVSEKPSEERFVIPKESKEKPKEEKDEKPKREDRPEVKPERETEKPKERKSPFKKIFRRKSV